MTRILYSSGEEVLVGDVIEYAGDRATVELVVLRRTGEPGNDWHIDETGPGVMIQTPRFGRIFLQADQVAEDEDLGFVSRRSL